ncbi:CcdC family protein [Brevibacillus sp. TJ4]|uniref:CcdC family protein n=1 Tax=Brevibacillus sp. TJ4 TaxID=3234853 RepID=UPI0037D673E9
MDLNLLLSWLNSSSVVGLVIPLIMAVGVIFLRMRRARKPVSVKSIILPPFFMATGFAMFLFPGAATSPMYEAIALLLGVLFSIPLIISSRFEVIGQDIYLKPSPLLFIILGGLLVVRIIIKLLINDSFTTIQTAGLFFVLAFGMLVSWRVAMLYNYRQLVKKVLRA